MKQFIEIEGHLYNLDMLVEVVPIGSQGIRGYKLKFCNGSFVEFEVPAIPYNTEGKEAKVRYYKIEALATAVRLYLFDRTIQVVPGPYTRRDEGDY